MLRRAVAWDWAVAPICRVCFHPSNPLIRSFLLWYPSCLKSSNHAHRRVRAVVTIRHGCTERSDWHPVGSPDATDAMHRLVERQTEMVCVDWEHHWDDEDEGFAAAFLSAL